MDLPLLENDLDDVGLIDAPALVGAAEIPPTAVICFFNEVIAEVAARASSSHVATMVYAFGEHAMYRFEHAGRSLVVFHPGVGAPLAAAFLEEAIALGCRTFIAVGGAGALVPELALGHPIVVDSAVRDEGTSYHYLPPSRVVDADPVVVAAIVRSLAAADVPFAVGRSWTTDAIYRETRGRTDRRVQEGCLTVEMEAAAFIAVARYRKVRFGQLLYAGDTLAGEKWDRRDWTRATSARQALFALACDAAALLDRE